MAPVDRTERNLNVRSRKPSRSDTCSACRGSASPRQRPVGRHRPWLDRARVELVLVVQVELDLVEQLARLRAARGAGMRLGPRVEVPDELLGLATAAGVVQAVVAPLADRERDAEPLGVL